MNYNISISTYEGRTLLFKEHTTCLLEDNYLTYHTDSDTIKINLESFNFTKENKDTKLIITSKDCLLILKELNNSVNIPLEHLKFNKEDNKVTIEYKLPSQENILKINIEIGEIRNDL